MCKGEAIGNLLDTLSDSLALNSTYAAWTSPSPMRPIFMEEVGDRVMASIDDLLVVFQKEVL